MPSNHFDALVGYLMSEGHQRLSDIMAMTEPDLAYAQRCLSAFHRASESND